MKKLKSLMHEWGVPASILTFWAVAAIYTVHALVGMEKASLQFRLHPPAIHETTQS